MMHVSVMKDYEDFSATDYACLGASDVETRMVVSSSRSFHVCRIRPQKQGRLYYSTTPRKREAAASTEESSMLDFIEEPLSQPMSNALCGNLWISPTSFQALGNNRTKYSKVTYYGCHNFHVKRALTTFI